MSSLSGLIEQYVVMRNQRSALAAHDKVLSARCEVLKSEIMQLMAQVGTFKGASERGHSVSMKKVMTPAVVDWSEFYEYVKSSGNFELLQKRLSPPAFRERWDAGEGIPGTSVVEIWDLSITQSRK